MRISMVGGGHSRQRENKYKGPETDARLDEQSELSEGEWEVMKLESHGARDSVGSSKSW